MSIRGDADACPRGKLYTRDNLRQHLSMRNFMERRRDHQEFANQLERLLAKLKPAPLQAR